MDISNTALANAVGGSPTGSVQAAAQTLVLKKAMSLQADSAMQLLASVPPQPALASSGSLGTRLNVYA